ncbi:MAG: integrase family protein [Frankiales bacterium]|nr:integrase family protein [Frankiales bacterium]
MEVAVRDSLVQRNVAAVIKRPLADSREAAYLTAEQAAALLLSLEGDRLAPLVRFLLSTGLRRGEALALRWEDVDLDGALLRVRGTLGRTSAGLSVGRPETEKSRRTVPLPRVAVSALRLRLLAQQADRARVPRAWEDSGSVSTNELGTALEPRNVLRRFQVLAKAAGLPKGVGLHTLRLSTASLLLAAGTHTKVVQEHLGHSSYAITADICSHVAPQQAREAADRLDDSLDW